MESFSYVGYENYRDRYLHQLYWNDTFRKYFKNTSKIPKILQIYHLRNKNTRYSRIISLILGFNLEYFNSDRVITKEVCCHKIIEKVFIVIVIKLHKLLSFHLTLMNLLMKFLNLLLRNIS